MKTIKKQMSQKGVKSNMDFRVQDPKDFLWEHLGLSELEIIGFSKAMKLLEAMVSMQDAEGKNNIYL